MSTGALGVFCAVGHHGLRTLSKDGGSWSEPVRDEEESLHLKSVVFGGGMILAAGKSGANGYYFRSRDGVQWEEKRYRAGYGTLGNFNWVNGKFIHSNGKGSTQDVKPYIRTSTNGFDWSGEKRISGTKMLRRIVEGNGRFVAVGDYGRRSWSVDGENWENVSGTKPLDTLIDVAFGNGVFVGGGLHGMRMFSEDGETWSERVEGKEGEHINSMIWDGERFVGVGQGATYLSSGGRDWERVSNQGAPVTAAFGNGVFVGTLWRGRIQRSDDAISWETVADYPDHVERIRWARL